MVSEIPLQVINEQAIERYSVQRKVKTLDFKISSQVPLAISNNNRMTFLCKNVTADSKDHFITQYGN